MNKKLTFGCYLCPKCKKTEQLFDYFLEDNLLIGYCLSCGEKIQVELIRRSFSHPKDMNKEIELEKMRKEEESKKFDWGRY